MKTKKTRFKFYVKAIWDDESDVYYSESNIMGLHIETDTLDQFEEVLDDIASELIYYNHFSVTDLKDKTLRDLIPTVFFRIADKTDGTRIPA